MDESYQPSCEEFDTDDSSPPEDPDNYVDEGEESFTERDRAVLLGPNKTAIAQLLLTKSKKCAARYLKEECLRYDAQNLLQSNLSDLVFTEVLNILLNPSLDLSYLNTIKWLKWLIAGGSTPKDFYQKVEQFDNPTTCILVWTADFMAYRCRTCGISRCMSLCLDCFNKGNHEGHDYNMFKSQAGGACDCGNRAVMAEEGFCSRHRGSSRNNLNSNSEPPSDLLLLAKLMMPRLLLRLILHCRSHGGSAFYSRDPIEDFEPFVTFLQELCCRGAAMRNIVTETFCNPEIYKSYTEIRPGTRFFEDTVRCQKLYYEALESIPFGEVPPGYEDISTLHGPLIHTTFLEEILFWTLKFEFPQKLVCLLLNMRPDPVYEDAFARAFVQHYSRISVMLVKAEESDPLSHRVVHVSVQLFSDQKLAYKMTDSYHLLHVIVLSVKKMIKNISVPSTLHDMSENTHKVVNCADDLMKNHSYWPLVSDLNNILSHELISKKFMSDSRLLTEWFSFLSYFQGMNNNLRELNQHVEYEPQSYYAAFSAELEVSASPLWAMLSHMKDESTKKYTLTVLKHCLLELQTWFKEIGFRRPDRQFHPNEATFHVPLHRTFSLLLCHAVKKQGVKLEDVLPSSELLTLMLVHPLRVQVAFHEIICNLWVRNGLQIKGQAMTYAQCHFCNSMFDPDLFLLQIGAGELPKDSFLMSIIERFHVLKYLSFSKQPPDEEPEAEGNRFKMLESCLVFLSALMTNRHNLGLSEEEIAEKEIITLMCTHDKTHSRLMEYLPEKCASNPLIDFDHIVKKYTKYIEPECQKSGAMKEGLYVPMDFVWEEHFDPVMTMTRCLHKKEYQNSLNRFKQFCRKSGRMSARKAKRLWPPYRLPGPVDNPYKDPRRILSCRTFHGVLFTLLYKALHDSSYTENMLSLSIHLLELAIDFQSKNQEGGNELASKDIPARTAECPDGFFYLWYSTDDIFKNCISVINLILLNNYLSFQPSAGGESFAVEMEEIEGPDVSLCLTPSNRGVSRPLPSGSEVVPYQDGASALVVSNDPSYRGSDVPSRELQPSQGESSAIEMEEIEGSDGSLCLPPSNIGVPRPLPSGSEVVPYQDGASALVVSNVPSYRGSDVPSRELQASQVVCTLYTTVGEARSSYFTRRNNALPSSTSGPCADTSLLPSNYSGGSGTKALVESSNMDESSGSVNLSTDRCSTGEYLNVNESLISLLLKLHSKLSDRRGSYRPQFDTPSTDSRIGDGPYFIAKVLNKLGQGSDEAKRCILENLNRLYPEAEEEIHSSSDEETSSRIKEEKKKRAKEWQKKVMASFNRKQQIFMAKNMQDIAGKEGENLEEMDDEEQNCEKEYDCVICNQSIPSTVKRPFGLIVYMQPTSVHGNRSTSSKGFDIPVNERTKVRLRHQRHTLSRHMRSRTEIFNQYFDLHSWLSSMDLGWDGGIYVQTCGHHLHLDCHMAYVLSLQSQPVSQENGANYPKGEYFCPFCRQLSNSILPIFSETGTNLEAWNKFESEEESVEEIDSALKNIQVSSFSPILNTALYTVMDDLTKATPLKYRTLSVNPEVSLLSTFVFLSSVLRTNLEIELVQRGGSLVNQQDEPKIFAIKRSSLIPLMHILAQHAKILTKGTPRSRSDPLRGGSGWIRLVWSSLSQRSSSDFEGAVTQNDREVPMLFKDPITILIQMVLFLPANSIKRYFRSVVLNVYRLVVAKAAVSAIRSLPEERRVVAIMNGPLAPLLSMAYNNLRDSPFFRCDKPSPYYSEETSSSTEFTCELREVCLDFLRIAAILKSHLMEERLPTITDPLGECGTLEQFLDLWDTCSVVNTSVMGKMCGSLIADNRLSSNMNISFTSTGTPVETQVGELSGAIKVWCSEVSLFALKAPILAASLLTNVRFFKPCLLNLPDSFDEVFKYYHKRKCTLCSSVPKDPGICLVCGTLVCMRQMCCNQDGMLEGVQHALDCGAGTAIYLAVLQAAVIVVRHPRVCLWGCIHLDCYGEEDKDLKRGRPLYLSRGRYQLLQEQWLGHSFMHTPHKWVWHNNFI